MRASIAALQTVSRGRERTRARHEIERAPQGRLAQLVEHCVHIAGVTGSSPVPPTIISV
jgi:hypothetical protein